LDYATGSGVICVAAAGNQGSSVAAYPAGYSNVIGVASTNNQDLRSPFSNYGSGTVWMAAPGEGIITTYPWGSYAAVWGTSLSAPFVSGSVSLMIQARRSLSQASPAAALTHAKPLTSDLGYGRLDIVQALQAAISGH
jgi:thermitase